jgi:hypothetical protein
MNRIQVTVPSPVITSRHSSAPSGAVTSPNGARNGRTASGLRKRSTNTPTHTIANAESVPTLTSASSASIGSTPARIATSTPVTSVVMTGVCVRASTCATIGGSMRSRAITKKIRI